ncbi:acetyl-CoA synthetase-like protein [Zopfia rhizophila CBS 207.26]|uniref:Acetyl-CoA synthetase-like protein n=1 Tax=Zopfia rhizophila CBS 207.26 TaxID=1314779 RepID=A0A6A6EM54_9PEZI|nr:acetyl-CoA synthetase-like protein [Zopfia rhizophila CBS 207.26]
MQVIPYTLPAAAAGLAYLNGRFALSYDWALLSSFVAATVGGVIHEWRDDINLFYNLEGHAQSSRADHPWIIHNGRSWTYAEAYEIVVKYGTWLKSKGVQKGEVVAMDFVNSEVFIWIWFGLWSIGAKPAFINYNLAGKLLIHTIRTSTARLVIVDEDAKDNFSEDVMAEHGFAPRPADQVLPEGRQARYKFPDAAPAQQGPSPPVRVLKSQKQTTPERRKLEIVFFDKQLGAWIESLEPIRQPDEERGHQKLHDMAMLIYTSGTTGLPKPAVMSWGKANLGAGFVAGWIPLKKNDIMYTAMPLYHSSASVLGVCSALRAGTTISIGKKFSHKTFWPEVRSSKATIIQYVGETCRYLLAAPKSEQDKKHNVRAAFGNGMRPDVWNPFKERFNIPTICEFYSATESPSGMWNRSTNAFSAGAVGRNGSVAALLVGPSLTIIKMDPESDPPSPLRNQKTGLCLIAGYDEPGELLYKLDPDNISKKFQGYFGNNKATDSKILRDVKAKGDAYFRTGDLMRWDKEGRWYFVDRIGDTFRWKAENVSTAEVADAIGKHDAIEEANVYGVLIPRHDGRAGCAAVVLKQKNDKEKLHRALVLPSPQTLKSLAEHLNKALPKFAVPLFIRVTEGMQTTGTNKHQKHLLQQEGIDVERVEESGDVLYWLKDGTYERFTLRELDRIQGGHVKL